MKQKCSQSVDAYLTNLSLMIPECNYHKDVLDDLLKDQFIFDITVKEIQDSLLSKIASGNSKGKCLLEARKIRSQIKQSKLLGINTNVSYDAIGTYSGKKDIDSNPKAKERAKATDLRVITVVTASSVELNTLLESALLMDSSATNAMVKTILAKYVILRPGHRVMTKVISVNLDLRVHLRVKTSMKVYKSFWQWRSILWLWWYKTREYNIVETMDYHDVVISSSEQAKCRIMCNLKMKLGTKSCLNKCKDTGMNGNVLPIGVYKCHGGNVDKLAKTIDRSVRLVAYNNMEIKQYGT